MQEGVSRTEMSNGDDESSSGVAARDNRRWLIGVGISIAFGLFSVVMALLSYSAKTEPLAPPGANASPTRGTGAEPARRGKAKGNRRGDPIVTPAARR